MKVGDIIKPKKGRTQLNYWQLLTVKKLRIDSIIKHPQTAYNTINLTLLEGDTFKKDNYKCVNSDGSFSLLATDHEIEKFFELYDTPETNKNLLIL